MQCFVCKNDGWKPLYQDLLICRSCGFIRAKDNFFKLNPERLYGKDYYFKGQYADYEREKLPLLKNFDGRLKTIIKYKKRGSLLDVGCAYGYFLLAAKKYFNVQGIDLDESITRKAQEISESKVLTGDFLKKNLGHKKFDAITLFDSIEHLKNPCAAIQKVNSLLKKGGIVVIETGDISSLLPRLQKDKWRLIDPKVHLSYFSRKTLRLLLEDNGFKVLSLTYVPFHRSLTQILHRLTRGKVTLPFLSNFSVAVNTYDIMFVVAKKK